MIQDIQPLLYNNAYVPRKPIEEDLVYVFKDDTVLLFGVEDMLLVPTVEMICKTFDITETELTYLFCVDDDAMFLVKDLAKIEEQMSQATGFDFHTTRVFRTLEPQWIGFAGMTALHLNNWYAQNQFCGHCGDSMHESSLERAMVCEKCGMIEYPKISPAIIVAITNGDKLLLTKYANRPFTRYALVAGFAEIGETIEETVKREVMEEVGISIKNLKYYKSQPWGFSGSLLLGFYAELDGEAEISLDTNELKEATWVLRDEIPEDSENEMSLTYTMMQAFKNRAEK